MVVIQQYLFGLTFFGFLGFVLGGVREFRNLKKVTRATRLDRDEWRQLLACSAKSLASMSMWWTAMYLVVIGISALG